MNAIVNMILLAGDKFMPAIHLNQSRFSYTACGLLTKNKKIKKERTKQIKETGNSTYKQVR